MVPRGAVDVDQAVDMVRPICDAVAAEGEVALARFSEKFDRVVPKSFRVSEEDLVAAEAGLDDDLRQAFKEAIKRRRKVAEAGEIEPQPPATCLAAGAYVTNRLIPVHRVGLYVPGGLAPLSSSVLMNVIPAQVAGVSEIAVASPPQEEFGGLPHPATLAMCHLLGVKEVYAVGGAQAVAMFAYGVAGLCPKVDMVTGPGNIYVVAAKRLLRGRVGIDSEAGPTEIAVLADDSANPAYVAADLLSQAEHDPMASSVLVTDSAEFAQKVDDEIVRQLAQTTHVERMTTALTGQQSGTILVRDLEQGIKVLNDYAAEHLEIQTRNAEEVASRITNAGAIFIGPYSPVPLGDYTAGSTHVLPTSGTAKFSSGLNARSFMKSVHVVNYSKEALAEVASVIEAFGMAEDLPAHAYAATVRREK